MLEYLYFTRNAGPVKLPDRKLIVHLGNHRRRNGDPSSRICWAAAYKHIIGDFAISAGTKDKTDHRQAFSGADAHHPNRPQLLPKLDTATRATYRVPDGTIDLQ